MKTFADTTADVNLASVAASSKVVTENILVDINTDGINTRMVVLFLFMLKDAYNIVM